MEMMIDLNLFFDVSCCADSTGDELHGALPALPRLQGAASAATEQKKDGEKRGSCSLPAGFMLKVGLCQIQTEFEFWIAQRADTIHFSAVPDLCFFSKVLLTTCAVVKVAWSHSWRWGFGWIKV